MEGPQRSPSRMAPWFSWLSGRTARRRAQHDADARMRQRIEQLMELHAHDPDDGFAVTVCMVDEDSSPEGETVLCDPSDLVDLDASLDRYVLPAHTLRAVRLASQTPWSPRWAVVLVVAGLSCALLAAGSLSALIVAWLWLG